ncbi:MAG: discoidin domain-containing protein [Elusimicrobia bacterium]|nr:discoidin domain-containing protein [Elusimicrobiota bacterium]
MTEIKKRHIVGIVSLSLKSICLLLVSCQICSGLNKRPIPGGWHIKTADTEFEITAVDQDLFRIRAFVKGHEKDTLPNTYLSGEGKQTQFKFRNYDDKSFGVISEKYKIDISNDFSGIDLKYGSKSVINNLKLKFNKGKNPNWNITFFTHSKERVYGIGNTGLGKSGGLIKTSAVTGMEGGVSKLPFFISSLGYGIFVHDEKDGMSWEKEKKSHSITVPGEVLDMYILTGKNPYDLLDAYTDLTGKPLMPPLWSFGFMMSRWGYSGWDDIKEKWDIFRSKEIPVDVFIYDYDWFIKDWEWNRKCFPSPAENLELAESMGIKVVGIRKPRCDYDENLEFIKSKGWVLENTPSDFNLFIPEVREWWWEKNLPLLKDGIAGWWNDEAEHAWLEYYYMVDTQYKGMQKQYPGKRVWTINRAFTPGLQRLGAAVWTGDVNSSWEHLQNQPCTFLNYGITGMPYSSSDIGGFIGKPSPEMYVRWIQLGVFTPVMRAHSQQHSDRWPWAFGSDAEDAVKKAIELRYRLIPYLYSYAHKAYVTGEPLLRPLFFDFGDDPQTFNMDDEFLVGNEILAAPVLNQGGKRIVYLPEGLWYDFKTGETQNGPVLFENRYKLDEIPVFIKGGSIIPVSPVVQHTGEKDDIPLEINLYPGSDTGFVLYLDDGETYDYEKGEYNETLLKWNDKDNSLTIEDKFKGYKGLKKHPIEKINLFGAERIHSVSLNGIKLEEINQNSEKNCIEIVLKNFEIFKTDDVNRLDIDFIKKEPPEKDAVVIERSETMKKSAIGDLDAVNSLIKMLKEASFTEKIMITNALAMNMQYQEVFDTFAGLIPSSEPAVQKTILKAIKTFALDRKYAEIVLPLLTSNNDEIAGMSGEIVSSVYKEDAAEYLLSGLTRTAFKDNALSSSIQEENLSAKYAFDGKMDTRWSSSASDPQWIVIDTGQLKDITGIKLFWETAFGKKYLILVSADKKTWKTVYKENNGDGGTDEITFDPVKARYVAVYCLERGTQWGYSLWEAEIK